MDVPLPKLPGYHILHNPLKSSFKRVSSIVLENNRYNNDNNKPNLLHQSLTIPAETQEKLNLRLKVRGEKSKSMSQSVHVNHFGPEIEELYQPIWLKLDKKVVLKL